MIELTFSKAPPSVNNLFFNRAKGRGVTPQYRSWKQDAGWELKSQKQKPIHGPVSVMATFEEGRADLDNLSKPTLDLLVSHGLIDDDGPSVVKQLNLSFSAKLKGVCVKVFEFR